jgi:N-acetyl-alpha-D-muramate 1-phosphate uridylyltransferase
MKAMLFAAGLGTRLKPLTDNKPKALVEINGISLLEIVIQKLVRSGCNEIVINVHHFSKQIIDFLHSKDNFGIRIDISDETDLLLDTGGGLKKASQFLIGNEPFLVHNVDIISDVDLSALLKLHMKNNCLATLVCSDRPSSRHFLVNDENALCGWKNEKTGEVIISRESNLYLKPMAFCGIHVINPEIFSLIKETGTFSIVQLYLRLAAEHDIKAKCFNEMKWIDVGSTESLEMAKKLIKSF